MIAGNTVDTLKAMRGEAIFSLARDILANESERVRGFEQSLVDLGVAHRINPDRLSVVVGLDAAVYLITLLIGTGQATALRKKDPPKWIENEKDRAKWLAGFVERDTFLRQCADQVRAVFVIGSGEEELPPKETDDNGEHHEAA